LRFELTDTSNGSIDLEPLPGTAFQLHQPGQALPWSLLIEADPASPLGTGSLRLDIYAFGNGCTQAICAAESIMVQVAQIVDLEFANVSEQEEEDPGGFVRVNNDDDNDNGVPDRDEVDGGGAPIPVAGEDDLVALTVTADGRLVGTLTLDVPSGASRIRIYQGPDRSNPVTLPTTWELGGLPKSFFVTLYVEGVQPSATARDVRLDLSFDGPGESCQDRVTLTVINAALKEVSFTGGRYRKVYSDDGSLGYSDPHWQDNSNPLDGDAQDAGDRRYPVAYIRSLEGTPSVMRMGAKIKVEPAGAFALGAKIRGEGPGEIDFQNDATLDGNELTMQNTDAAVPLADTVDVFDPLRIEWSVSRDGGQTWCPAGASENPVYVTLGDPVSAGLGGSNRRHTLFRNSCRDAQGATTQEQVLAGVWSDFADRVVMRAEPDANGDPVQLTYYANWFCGNITTNALLSSGDGQCGAWASFMLDMLRAHGIDYADEYVLFRYSNSDFPNPANRGFLVKDWNFALGGGISGHAQLTYLNLPPAGADWPGIVNSTYVWRFPPEVTDATGVPGQGTVNPASFFSNHQVVRINGVYYDPSYGNTYNTLAEIDDQAIAGHFVFVRAPDTWPVNEQQVNLDLNGDGEVEDVFVDVNNVFLIEQNPPGNQLEEVVDDYPFP